MTDSEPVNKVKRCTSSGTTSRKWSASAAQKSDWISMSAGVESYVEVLHRGVTGSANNVAVGYLLDPTGNGPNGTGAVLADNTGVMPGYLIWQYFNPPLAFSSDSATTSNLYFTKLSSQGVAVTPGSGLATIRLSADQTTATVKFSYSGLTTAVTGKHIHNDQYLTHPSQIIFDMDSATPNADGTYTWHIAPVGTFTNTADILQLIREGKAYINIHTVNYPAGEIRGNFTIANGAQNFVPPLHPSPGFTIPSPSSATDADLSRFLSQATFGPTPSDFDSSNGASLRTLGFAVG